MARWRPRSAAIVGSVLAACALTAAACSPAPPKRAPATSADLDAWLGVDSEPSPRARSIAMPRIEPPTSSARTSRTQPDEPRRPRRRARIDVNFQKADLVSAFQLLADAGRFNVVMQDGLTGQVSATMRGVDPFDALVALAEANGVEVRYDGSIVVLTKR